MGSSFSIPKLMACAAIATLPPADAKKKADWGVSILYDSSDPAIATMAQEWEDEFRKVTDGIVLLKSTSSVGRDVNAALQGHESDGVFIYLGHGRNDGRTPFPILGPDGLKSREIVNALKGTRSTMVFNCCNVKKTAPGTPIPANAGTAVVLFAQPNSKVGISLSGQPKTDILSQFKRALKRQTDHQLAALDADDRVLKEWKEHNAVYITDEAEQLEIAALDEEGEGSFQVTVNKSTVLTNATSPVESLIPFKALN